MHAYVLSDVEVDMRTTVTIDDELYQQVLAEPGIDKVGYFVKR